MQGLPGSFVPSFPPVKTAPVSGIDFRNNPCESGLFERGGSDVPFLILFSRPALFWEAGSGTAG